MKELVKPGKTTNVPAVYGYEEYIINTYYNRRCTIYGFKKGGWCMIYSPGMVCSDIINKYDESDHWCC